MSRSPPSAPRPRLAAAVEQCREDDSATGRCPAARCCQPTLVEDALHRGDEPDLLEPRLFQHAARRLVRLVGERSDLAKTELIAREFEARADQFARVAPAPGHRREEITD